MWINDVFFYTVGNLKGIAEHYESLYTDAHTASLFLVAERKADFDRALDNIGRGKWKGLENSNFGAYKYLGRQQQIIIADILGISNRRLEGIGFFDTRKLRSKAYTKMAAKLNGEKI